MFDIQLKLGVLSVFILILSQNLLMTGKRPEQDIMVNQN